MAIKGVIRPPPEIRAVADRTASYVAKNGRAFETRILSSAKGKTPKFAFLQPSNPFHAYYQDRVQFYENGGEDAKEDEKKEEENKAQDKSAATGGGGDDDNSTTKQAPGSNKIESKATHSAIDPVAKALLTHRNRIAQLKSQNKSSTTTNDQDGRTEAEKANQAPSVSIPAPQPMHFIHIIPPASLTIVQIETIQLVAQMTALDGKGGTFLSALTRREWNNPQFNFTQPRHGHFAYFSALVDAYRHVLNTWTSNEDVGATVKEMSNNPQRCLEVAAYRAEYNRHLAEERRRGENTPQVAQIDWNDFVVVETIDFGKEEQVVTLPPPPPAEIQPPRSSAGSGKAQNADDMDDSGEEEDDDGEQIRVVGQYQPTVVSARDQASSMGTVVDPITGKRVRVADMPEHMRIQLMDPKWAEERKKFQEKQKDSNLVGGDVVANNLARLAAARGSSVRTRCCHDCDLFRLVHTQQGPELTVSILFIRLSGQRRFGYRRRRQEETTRC